MSVQIRKIVIENFVILAIDVVRLYVFESAIREQNGILSKRSVYIKFFLTLKRIGFLLRLIYLVIDDEFLILIPTPEGNQHHITIILMCICTPHLICTRFLLLIKLSKSLMKMEVDVLNENFLSQNLTG